MALKIDSQITFLYTNDLLATSEFYEDCLGLKLALDQGLCRIYQVCINGFLGFCANKEAGSNNKKDIIFTLVTPDVDAWYEHLKRCGVEIEKEPQYNPKFQIYHTFFRDPNGYLIEIQRFEDPAWN